MKNAQIRRWLLVSILASGAGNIYAETFDFTGAPETYTVPANVTEIQIEAWGASGGGTFGGNGGYAIGTLQVTPGQELYVYVGEQGKASGARGSGGGASDVRTVSGDWYSANGLSSRLIVAAGGGGSGYAGAGGAGGGTDGGDGTWNRDSQGTQFGLGATQNAGGGYDVGDEGDQNCLGAMAGEFGYGGDARYVTRGNTCTDDQFYAQQDPWTYRATHGAFNGGGTYDLRGGESGGGGGGWYGGGAPGSGDHGGGAGGGSSYIGGVLNGTTTSDVWNGNGRVIITETDTQPTEPVPTMSIWGIAILCGMMGLLGMYRRRRV